ncbi:hypothetical protein PCCS19_19980 [Paenibacillus sp. CCS19]|nr:hypothetical protein PCCS19_19980 [Paenibacillus cellulosilyticus]
MEAEQRTILGGVSMYGLAGDSWLKERWMCEANEHSCIRTVGWSTYLWQRAADGVIICGDRVEFRKGMRMGLHSAFVEAHGMLGDEHWLRLDILLVTDDGSCRQQTAALAECGCKYDGCGCGLDESVLPTAIRSVHEERSLSLSMG